MAKDSVGHFEKKVLQEEMIYQLDNSLGKLKDFLGEKKFNSRIKKAVKLLTDGIGRKKLKKETQKAGAAPQSPAKESAAKATKGRVPAKKVADAQPRDAAQKTVSAKPATSAGKKTDTTEKVIKK